MALQPAASAAPARPRLRATFIAMLFRSTYFFAYFWFSYRPAAGEASAYAK